MATRPVIFEEISEIYGPDYNKDGRFQQICEYFMRHYNESPDFLARAPGRVNIIGEHIDYCGYAVFPMAIEQDILFAVSYDKSDNKKRVPEQEMYVMKNYDADAFKDYKCNVKEFVIDGHKWHHYVLCGHKAIVDECKLDAPRPMKILVDGTVPRSAGLSSSSALVCCSGLATMHANEQILDRTTLANACTKCERHVGTESGGMDQAISFLAESGTAKLIEFNPLKATDVPLPAGATFVIANSLREMTKSENAGEYYNKRVSECRIAAQILSKKAGIEWRKTRRLAETQQALSMSLPEMLVQVEKELHKEPYTREEVKRELEISDEELVSECLNPTTAGSQEFKLYHRAKHVYSEANRVWNFKRICEEEDGNLKKLGDLMNESQMSCSEDYECSCDELDELTKICREAGALGSRLTGAGWGGCTVSLVQSGNVEKFIEDVKARYYVTEQRKRTNMNEVIFATKPGTGAGVINLFKRK